MSRENVDPERKDSKAGVPEKTLNSGDFDETLNTGDFDTAGAGSVYHDSSDSEAKDFAPVNDDASGEDKEAKDADRINFDAKEADFEERDDAEDTDVRKAEGSEPEAPGGAAGHDGQKTQSSRPDEQRDDAQDADARKDAAEDGKAVSDDKKNKKKIFGKKDKKDQQIDELTDKHQRLMAEFQNFRNRSEKEKSAMFEVGAKTVIEKILPVLDNFERGIKSMSKEDLSSPVGEGMTMIYKQFMAALNDMGVEVIETEGREFDPALHNAVMHVEDENLGENVIAEEFQKGYTYRGSVVRHSMVKVAN